jgi:hypothetical protein
MLIWRHSPSPPKARRELAVGSSWLTGLLTLLRLDALFKKKADTGN